MLSIDENNVLNLRRHTTYEVPVQYRGFQCHGPVSTVRSLLVTMLKEVMFERRRLTNSAEPATIVVHLTYSNDRPARQTRHITWHVVCF
jgi:hypothetical protein